MIKLQIDGAEDVARAIERRGGDARVALVKGLFAAAMIVRSAAVRGINKGKKSGRVYRNGGVLHRASAPDEYPAADTGILASSIHHRVDPLKLEGVVEASAKYALPLELKPPERGGRPFLSRAYEENVGKVQATIGKALSEALAAADRKARRT